MGFLGISLFVFTTLIFFQNFNNKSFNGEQKSSDIDRRKVIAALYPEFVVNYENHPCFAGCSVKTKEDSENHYYAYITHGSGLPIAAATCFRVDALMNAYLIGKFPEITDSYAGYRDIDPQTCRGIK